MALTFIALLGVMGCVTHDWIAKSAAGRVIDAFPRRWLSFVPLDVQGFFQSLSLTSASVLVAVISAVAALLIGRITSAVLRWFAAVLFPFALAYCVYWIPVWLGADGSEYLAWAPLGVGLPFLAGLVPSAVVTLVVRRRAQ